MADIIEFKPKILPSADFDGEHILELHVYQHDEGHISGACSSDLHDYRATEGRLKIAEILEHIAWLVRKECADIDDFRGDLLAVAHVYAEGAVRVRVDNDKVKSEAQFEWLDGLLDDAKTAARIAGE